MEFVHLCVMMYDPPPLSCWGASVAAHPEINSQSVARTRSPAERVRVGVNVHEWLAGMNKTPECVPRGGRGCGQHRAHTHTHTYLHMNTDVAWFRAREEGCWEAARLLTAAGKTAQSRAVTLHMSRTGNADASLTNGTIVYALTVFASVL